ncbi:MAG: hypothetical protein SFX73_18390 [Kofleriaceae bacterium]|nr:hypothetical protein [Kofleriaceae bacterium]
MSDPTLELQQELQRFATRFLDRISQAVSDLERSPHAAVRDEGLRKSLLYASSAMEIATGPSAEVNLLDMFVFVRLSRTLLEKHWIPRLYGKEADEMDDAFVRADQEITELVDRALGRDRRAQLEEVVHTWLADNPNQIRVEGLRLADFSGMAGAAASKRAIQAKGLLSSVKVASDAANQAMLLADRAMFLLHRMPFLWRMQVRVGVNEVTSDTLVRAQSSVPWAQLARFAKGGAIVAGLTAVTALMWMRRGR